MSIIQQAEGTVEASLKRAERLRQSILKQAFSGKLVPQDPNDEPASVVAGTYTRRASPRPRLLANFKPKNGPDKTTQAAYKPSPPTPLPRGEAAVVGINRGDR